ARKYLIEEQQLKARIASNEEHIARLEEIITRDRTNLAAIPDAAVPDSEVVDELLQEIVRSEKAIRVLVKQIESRDKLATERRKRARDTLAQLTRED
ncbi:MAG: hypothetical protein JRF63_15395, partial [Deltaproteobacteria bacterium]|nr:hypothetical protein [Deltaproteobacteria bacterium]